MVARGLNEDTTFWMHMRAYIGTRQSLLSFDWTLAVQKRMIGSKLSCKNSRLNSLEKGSFVNIIIRRDSQKLVA